MEPTGLMRWYGVRNGLDGKTLQQQWGIKNGSKNVWAWSNLEWRDVPEVFE